MDSQQPTQSHTTTWSPTMGVVRAVDLACRAYVLVLGAGLGFTVRESSNSDLLLVLIKKSQIVVEDSRFVLGCNRNSYLHSLRMESSETSYKRLQTLTLTAQAPACLGAPGIVGNTVKISIRGSKLAWFATGAADTCNNSRCWQKAEQTKTITVRP